MSEAFTNGQLGDMIKEGFEATHRRQDIANGRTRKLEIWRATIVGGLIVLSWFANDIRNEIKDYKSNIGVLIDQKITENNQKQFNNFNK